MLMQCLCPKCGLALETKPHPEQWQAECERAVINARELLRLAGRPFSAQAVIELIRSVPPPGREPISEDSFCVRCVMEAQKFCQMGRDLRDFQPVLEYFARQVRALPPEQRALLEASLSG